MTQNAALETLFGPAPKGWMARKPPYATQLAARIAAHEKAVHPFAATPDALWTALIESHARMDDLRREMLQRVDAQARHAEFRLVEVGVADAARTRADLARPSVLALAALAGWHKGQVAVIIGNGPSLTMADLGRLSGAVTFASNRIFLAFDQTDWRPDYYTVEDFLVLEGARDQISALRGPVKIFPDTMRHHGVHDPDTIFVARPAPMSWDDPLVDPNFPAFSDDAVAGLHWGSTVVYTQIQLAAYMGCKEIYVIGLDHNYVLPGTREGQTLISDGEKNHFHPDYRPAGERWHQPNLAVLEVSYRRAAESCAQRGIGLFNASRQTKLTAIPRADFDKVFPLNR